MRSRVPALFLLISLLLPAGLVGSIFASGCIATADDCLLTAGFGCKTSSNASASSGTGGGGMGGCAQVSDCPALPPGPCQYRAMTKCDNHKCGVVYEEGPATILDYGSCKKGLCDAAGAYYLVPDDTDIPDDGNPCTKDSCTNGVLSHVLDPTAMCVLSGGKPGVCAPNPTSGAPSCVECTSNAACSSNPGYVCVSNKCAPSHCADNATDSGETDRDCGGTTGCPRCPSGRACMDDWDCASQICENNMCMPPTCTDHVQNGTETDQDCGGISCYPCTPGLKCLTADDCKGGVCEPPVPGMPLICKPSCTDGVQNGDEEGTDCGGANSMCPPCSN